MEISSIFPFYVAPGDKQKITFTFSTNLTGNLNDYKISIQKKDELNYIIKMNPDSISTNKLIAKFGGAKPGEYNVIVDVTGIGMSTLANGVTFKTRIEIDSKLLIIRRSRIRDVLH